MYLESFKYVKSREVCIGLRASTGFNPMITELLTNYIQPVTCIRFYVFIYDRQCLLSFDHKTATYKLMA